MIIIPFVWSPFFEETVSVDGVSYKFEFLWNHRGEYWTLSVFDNNNTLLIAGVKIVLEYDVLGRYYKTTLPKGVMLAIRDNEKDKSDIKFEDVGNTVDIIYVEEEEYGAV